MLKKSTLIKALVTKTSHEVYEMFQQLLIEDFDAYHDKVIVGVRQFFSENIPGPNSLSRRAKDELLAILNRPRSLKLHSLSPLLSSRVVKSNVDWWEQPLTIAKDDLPKSPSKVKDRKKLVLDRVFLYHFNNLRDQLASGHLSSGVTTPVLNFVTEAEGLVSADPGKYLDLVDGVNTILKKHSWRFMGASGFYSEPNRSKLLSDLNDYYVRLC